METKRNTGLILPKSTEKLNGERPRTDLPHRNKVLPTKSMPNGIELGVHSCFLEKGRVELLGVGEDSILDESIGLSLPVVPQVDEGGIGVDHPFGSWCG